MWREAIHRGPPLSRTPASATHESAWTGDDDADDATEAAGYAGVIVVDLARLPTYLRSSWTP